MTKRWRFSRDFFHLLEKIQQEEMFHYFTNLQVHLLSIVRWWFRMWICVNCLEILTVTLFFKERLKSVKTIRFVFRVFFQNNIWFVQYWSFSCSRFSFHPSTYKHFSIVTREIPDWNESLSKFLKLHQSHWCIKKNRLGYGLMDSCCWMALSTVVFIGLSYIG